MKVILGLLLVFLQNLTIGQTQSCNYSRYGADHTMCKYMTWGCQYTLLSSGLTLQDMSDALNAHNYYRKMLANGRVTNQPPASNMEEMKWDHELAAIAQRWADQCFMGKDSNRRSSIYPQVSQTIQVMDTASNQYSTKFASVVGLWYNQVIKPGFNRAIINSFQVNPSNEKYTQLMWATTNRVGCGYSYYETRGIYRKIYVCNYAPAGNMNRAVMYKTGIGASACIRGQKSAITGLCAS